MSHLVDAVNQTDGYAGPRHEKTGEWVEKPITAKTLCW